MKKLLWISILIGCSFLKLQAQRDTLTVISVNDFHGAFVHSSPANIPGATALAFTIDSLKRNRVFPNILCVSAGDNFGGSYFSKASNGMLLPKLFHEMNLSVSAIGNHEFDYGQDYLIDRWSKMAPKNWQITYVAANIFETGTTKRPAWMSPYVSVNYNLPHIGHVKIALVGLTTSNTPNQVDAQSIKGLDFSPNYLAILDSVGKNPAVHSADLRLLLTHIGTQQDAKGISWTETGDAPKLPSLYPYYSAILSGHSHKLVCGRIDSMPVLQANVNGTHISIQRFEFRREGRQLLVRPLDPLVIPVRPHIGLAEDIQDYFDNPLYNLGEVIAQCSDDLLHDRSQNRQFTDLGAYVTAAFADAYQQTIATPDSLDSIPVIGLCHFFGIRSSLRQGKITKLLAGDVLPFGSDLWAYRFNGAELKKILQQGVNNLTYGWLQMNNLHLGVINYGTKAPIEIQTISYKKNDTSLIDISDSTEIIVVVDAYIAQGGDGYLASDFPETHRIQALLPNATDAWMAFLRRIGTVSWNSNFLPILKNISQTHR